MPASEDKIIKDDALEGLTAIVTVRLHRDRLVLAAILASVAVGVVNVGMTLVAIRLLDRAGEAAALGSALMAVALSILALVFIVSAPAAPSARSSRSAA